MIGVTVMSYKLLSSVQSLRCLEAIAWTRNIMFVGICGSDSCKNTDDEAQR